MNKLSIPYPTLGIDIDGTIDQNPLFFQILTQNWPGLIIIISYRSEDMKDKTEEYLNSMFIRYDELILSKNMDKSSDIINNSINVYIDDQDEAIYNIPDGVTVLKMRNGGNFDFDNKKWMYSDKTGKML